MSSPTKPSSLHEIMCDTANGKIPLTDAVDCVLIETALMTALPETKMLQLFKQAKRVSDANLHKRVKECTERLGALEAACKILDEQLKHVINRRNRIHCDEAYAAQLNKAVFTTADDMWVHWDSLKDEMISFMDIAKHSVKLLILSINQAHQEIIRRNKKLIEYKAKHDANLFIPDVIFKLISEY